MVVREALQHDGHAVPRFACLAIVGALGRNHLQNNIVPLNCRVVMGGKFDYFASAVVRGQPGEGCD